jgi:hypothetical protein
MKQDHRESELWGASPRMDAMIRASDPNMMKLTATAMNYGGSDNLRQRPG